MVTNDHRLSIGTTPQDLKAEAAAEIRAMTDRIRILVDAIEQVDAALMVVMTDRSNDERQHLVTRCRNLSALLNGEPGELLERDNRDFCAEARLARGMTTAPELPSLLEMMGAA